MDPSKRSHTFYLFVLLLWQDGTPPIIGVFAHLKNLKVSSDCGVEIVFSRLIYQCLLYPIFELIIKRQTTEKATAANESKKEQKSQVQKPNYILRQNYRAGYLLHLIISHELLLWQRLSRPIF